MAQIDSNQIESTTYDITAKQNNKIFSMIKSVKYLYEKLGTTDISGVNINIIDIISNLNNKEKISSYTYDTVNNKNGSGNSLILTSKIANNNHISNALLLKNMNNILTSLNDAKPKYVNLLNGII